MLVNEIRQKLKEARITRNKLHTSAYTTLLGDVLVIGKNKGNRDTTDEEAVAVIKKFIKNLNDTNTAITSAKEIAFSDKEKYDNNLAEISLLETLLPRQLSEEELRGWLLILSGSSSVPVEKKDYMKYLKDNYAGQYNGSLANKVFDNFYGK